MSDLTENLGRLVCAEMFGERQLPLIDLLRTISRYAQGQEYHFLDMAKFNEVIATDPMLGQRIYWQEIIGRAHFAATSSAIRHVRWLDGCVDAVCHGNYLVFCSAFRGLLESSADSLEALYRAPQCLAENRNRIKEILEGVDTGREILVSRELEDSLNHFSHARKKFGLERDAPDSHRAKHVRDYMQILEKGQLQDIIECYSELCEVTHPSALSVLAYVGGEKTSDGTLWKIDTELDCERIAEFTTRYKPLLHELMMFVLNPILLTLYVIGKFPGPRTACPGVTHADLSAIPAYRKFVSLLDGEQE